jgi:cytoskeletal protein CcmA (bactofilin family)
MIKRTIDESAVDDLDLVMGGVDYFLTAETLTVKGDGYVKGTVRGSNLAVGRDLLVDGDLILAGDLDVAGHLYVRGEVRAHGHIHVGGKAKVFKLLAGNGVCVGSLFLVKEDEQRLYLLEANKHKGTSKRGQKLRNVNVS